MMSAPAAAKARAMPRPMPLVEPVTSATLPARAARVLIFSGLTAMFMSKASSLSGSQCAGAGRTNANADWLRARYSVAMEMHQVRYFLATVSELNFTKAAEKCNVTQPSLTRAIKQLEDELGGDLFRRERPRAQLTDLGQRMYPLLKQCYESALGARSLASAIKNGELGTLKLAISRTINLDLVTSHLTELNGLFSRLEVKLLRGTAPEIVELLKSGEAELA